MPVELCQCSAGETLETGNRITGLLWQQEKQANEFGVWKVNFQSQISAHATPHRTVGERDVFFKIEPKLFTAGVNLWIYEKMHRGSLSVKAK